MAWKKTAFVPSGLLLLLTSTVLSAEAPNNRPIIGVLSQSTNGTTKHLGDAYIAASYVKVLESAGARVVPLLIDQPDSYYQMMFSALNGVLFPGGRQNDILHSGYGKTARFFYNQAIKSYDATGDYFPVWGTCLGFELLTKLTSNQNLLTSVDAMDISYPLIFAKGSCDGRLYHEASPTIMNILSAKNVTYNHHRFGLTPTNFTKSSALRKFYRVLTTNFDNKGVSFISSFEAVNYPIYGVQFHPEKNLFEWTSPNIPHSSDAVLIAQFYANFFVSEARKNYHSFKSQTEEDKYIIFNQSPVYTGNISDFEQSYFFNL